MKSLYKRELAMMVGIVTLSFTLLSTAFMLLSYRYIISETRDRLERNAGYIASATGNYLQNFNSWNIFDNRADTWILYQTTMETVSSVSDASVIVASTQGEILYASDEGMYSKQIPQQIVDQILERGNYAGLTNLNGIYGSNRYIAGLPVQVQLDNPNLLVNVGVVLVSGIPADCLRCGAPRLPFSSLPQWWSCSLLSLPAPLPPPTRPAPSPRWRRPPGNSDGASSTCG